MNTILKKSVFGLLISGVCLNSAVAQDSGVGKMSNLDMCVNYSTLESEEQKQAYFKELDQRGQLSYKDHERVSKKEVGTTSTMCGMYMALGKPLAEQSRQIRPMTFKVVHVYPEMYYVSQSGMIVETYERKEGMMPPSLATDKPSVEPPPVLYQAPK